MNNSAISVWQLSKRFTSPRPHSHAVHEVFEQSLLAVFGRRTKNLSEKVDERNHLFWGLRDLSFDIHEGETVALIGHNGAGKSLLLRILSRITRPTSGEARLYGRVGSVLSIGAGFNRELTGRENIFFQGAVSGMKKKEIAQKLEEIVVFSGMEEFLEQPLKHYSDGMQVRLAFSIAAHLDFEILLMDEILAVADQDFIQTSIERLHAFNRAGRTLLIASHDFPLLENICTRGIMLHHGQLMIDGKLKQVIAEYQSYLSNYFSENDSF